MDIALVSEGLEKTDVQLGCWLNVVGYVEQRPKAIKHDGKGVRINVQALLIWNAGSLDVGAYERAVESRAKLDECLR